MDKFEFHSGPDKMVAELRHYSSEAEKFGRRKGGESYISFHGKGPRGGWVGGPVISEEYLGQLDDLIAEAKGWPFRCKGCGRAEEDCSADPCSDVIADRGETIEELLDKAEQKYAAQMMDDEPVHVPGLNDQLAPPN